MSAWGVEGLGDSEAGGSAGVGAAGRVVFHVLLSTCMVADG